MPVPSSKPFKSTTGPNVPQEVADLIGILVGTTFVAKRGTGLSPKTDGAPWNPDTALGVTVIAANPLPMLSVVPSASTISVLSPDKAALKAVKRLYPSAKTALGGAREILGIERNDDWNAKHGLAVVFPDPANPVLQAEVGEVFSAPGARWGFQGDKSAIQVVQTILGFAVEHFSVTAAILPTPFVAQDLPSFLEHTYRQARSLRYRLDLAAMPGSGITEPLSICVFGHSNSYSDPSVLGPFTDFASARKAALAVVDGEYTNYGRSGPSRNLWIPTCHSDHANQSAHVFQAKPIPTATVVPALPKDAPLVRLALGGRAHRILLLPQGETPAEVQAASFAVAEARLFAGYRSCSGFKPQSRLDWNTDLPRNAGKAFLALGRVKRSLEAVGIRVTVDAQLERHVQRADRRALGENLPFPQWTLDGKGGWTVSNGLVEQDADAKVGVAYQKARAATFASRCWAAPSGLKVKSWDRKSASHVETVWPTFPVYAFARIDATRVLARRSAIYSAKQGLGKTRFSVMTFLASGMQRGLWVLESRLVNEFKRELTAIGLIDHFHQIENIDDVKAMKRINVITYNRLWRPIGTPKARANFGPGETLAGKLAKYRLAVFLDESHKIKSPDSKQAVCARFLAQHAKRVILMTGTAVQSYPRNLLGLLSAGWGDGTAHNPYGASLRRPLPGGYNVYSAQTSRVKGRGELVAGSTRFADDYVEKIMYAPATTTQDGELVIQGTKSREVPRVKDLCLWRAFLAPKLLRRVPSEPEVRASGFKVPAADPQWVKITPDPYHYAYYHGVLTTFAQVWQTRLEEERKTGKIETGSANVLSELDALRFASTIPVIPHRWAPVAAELAYPSNQPTALMREAAKRICEWVQAGERVLVGAEKPSALQWLSVVLANADRWVEDAEPVESILALDDDINRRNKAIDHARDHSDVPVLMITIGKGKEGLNLPEFSKLITLDLGWLPGDLDQFRHRILRPGQVGDVEIVHLYHEGLVDSYIYQLSTAKADGISEAVDGQSSTFDYTKWKDFRTFALEMLSDEGFRFATDALRANRALAQTA